MRSSQFLRRYAELMMVFAVGVLLGSKTWDREAFSCGMPSNEVEIRDARTTGSVASTTYGHAGPTKLNP